MSKGSGAWGGETVEFSINVSLAVSVNVVSGEFQGSLPKIRRRFPRCLPCSYLTSQLASGLMMITKGLSHPINPSVESVGKVSTTTMTWPTNRPRAENLNGLNLLL